MKAAGDVIHRVAASPELLSELACYMTTPLGGVALPARINVWFGCWLRAVNQARCVFTQGPGRLSEALSTPADGEFSHVSILVLKAS